MTVTNNLPDSYHLIVESGLDEQSCDKSITLEAGRQDMPGYGLCSTDEDGEMQESGGMSRQMSMHGAQIYARLNQSLILSYD